MAKDKIFPLAGHHNADPGAIARGRKEADEMKCFRDLVLRFMSEMGANFEADKDHETNTALQNRIKPTSTDVIIDNHADASSNTSASGVGTFVSNNAGKYSLACAKELVDGLSKIYGIPNRGVRTESQTHRGKIAILNKPGIAVLIEHFFITNPNDTAAFDKHKIAAAKFVAEIALKYDNLVN